MMNPKDTFISAYQKYIHRTGSDSLLDRLLATDFFEAPASTKFHNSFAGGPCATFPECFPAHVPQLHE